MLKAQEAYGQNISAAEAGPVGLGRNLFPVLPQDSADRGPVRRGPFTLVADIRIDNRPELERALGLADPRGSSHSDAEILFEALLAWDTGAFDRIAGEFALAFWDVERARLLLARDVLGLRPLHYHRSDAFFAFASMPSGLHALRDVPYAVDEETLAESLALLPQVGSRSWFKGVSRVEPAHFLEVTERGVTSSRYWNPKGPSGKPLTQREYEEGLRSVLDAAVGAQLRGAGPIIAAQLSGGLDSTIVATSAATQAPESTIVAYTAVPRSGFDGPIPPGVLASEAERAAATARLYPNIEHVIVENGETSPIAMLDREFAYQQQPAPNLCNNVWGRTIYRLARDRGAKILFMGNAGNLTVSYFGLHWLPVLFRQGRFLKLARITWGAARQGVPWLSLGAQIVGPYLPAPIWRLVSRRVTDLREYAPVTASRVEELGIKARERALDFAYRPRKDPFETRMWALGRFDNGAYHKGVLGQWGLSNRDPTGDKRVIEFCMSVPPEEYIRDGVPRSLARRAFGSRMPAEVTHATIRGYQAADWYEGLGGDLDTARDQIGRIARCDDAVGVVDVKWLEDALETWPQSGWASNQVMMRYRHGVLSGLSVGHFIRKVSGTN